ncbi:hypothetical protein SAMN02799624_02948 [Paenibacillus sp. UNC496MF]|uniref:hypothetical protein n=1 Tax=Paenibacillus sp. UNC496MF TaxID=1502753 RepID=UPI0008F0DD1F|nr:hypothetical protein [Paenibacillus sp. UNC496MF]SFJ00381.1 hypothetical protein SAMN02799624_02948 [Paenibacillus sp. UNC496MF]
MARRRWRRRQAGTAAAAHSAAAVPRRWRMLAALPPSALLLALLGGCASGTMSGVDAHPPTKGLLHVLQQAGQMGNVSDRGYRVEVEAAEGQPEGGRETELRLRVLNPSGQPAEDLAEDMTKLMHFIVVSKDLAEFQHLHPTYEGGGAFSLKLTFPHGGPFLLIAEFMPDGKGLTVYKTWIEVGGAKPEANPPVPSAAPSVVADGIEVKLASMPAAGELKAGEMAMLDFSLRKAETGKRIVLEPYLGTPGHCVILDANAQQYLHVHAATEMSTGSSVMFHATFPKAGVYKLWGQFQYEGKVITAPFVVTVS